MSAGVNCPAEMTALVPAGLAVLALIHDDFDPSNPYFGTKPFDARGLVRIHNRLMSPRSQFFKNLEDGAHLGCGNEQDEDWYTWQLDWIENDVRPWGHGLKVHHPAPNTEGQFPYDPAIAEACDVIDQHIGIGRDASGKVVFFPEPTPEMFGKRVWITEEEVDPAYPELIDAIPDATQYYLEAGYDVVIAWGLDPAIPDVLLHPDVLARIVALNATLAPAADYSAPNLAARAGLPILSGGFHR